MESVQADPVEMAQRIDAEVEFNGMVDQGAEFARRLCAELKARGWKSYEKSTVCKVANFERNFMKGGRICEILSACLFGAFTDITMHVASKEYLDWHRPR